MFFRQVSSDFFPKSSGVAVTSSGYSQTKIMLFFYFGLKKMKGFPGISVPAELFKITPRRLLRKKSRKDSQNLLSGTSF